MHILIVEPNAADAESMKKVALAAGISATVTDLGQEALDFLQMHDYDLVSVPRVLPDISGYEVITAIRRKRLSVSIIMTAAFQADCEQAKALNLGADACVLKPVNAELFVSQIQAVVRRAHGHVASVITVGGLTLNIHEKTAHFHGFRLDVTKTQYRILEILMMRKGKTVSRELFMDSLYHEVVDPGDRVVDVYIGRLRKLLETPIDNRTYIRTVHGTGYMIDEPVHKSL